MKMEFILLFMIINTFKIYFLIFFQLTVILKQKNSPEVPKDFKKHDYMIIEMNDERIISVIFNRKNSIKFKAIEQELPNKDIVTSLKLAMFDPWSNTVPPLEDMVSIVMKPSSKMTMKIHNSVFMKQYMGIGKQVIMQYTSQFTYTVFKKTLNLDDSKVQKITNVMRNAMISYFSTTECNGEDVYKRFIKDDFQKKDVVDIMLKIVSFPTSKAFRKLLIDNKIEINEHVMKTLKTNEKKNVFDMVGGIMDDISKAPQKEMKNLKSIVSVLGKDTKFNVFEKEFFTFVQKLFNQLNKAINNAGAFDFDKLELDFLNQYLPASTKTKVVAKLKAIFNVLKDWKYDADKAPQENVLLLMKKLDGIQAFDLLHLDYITILSKKIIEESQLPTPVEKILKAYLTNLDHVILIQKMTKFGLQSFGVAAPHKKYIDDLLKSKNLDDYFFTFANTIKKNGRKLEPKQKEMITKFLETRNRKIAYDVIKDLLKTKYQVDGKGLHLLETILMDGGDMESFKDLPILYSVNFFPKLAAKLLKNMKNLDLPAILTQLNTLIKDDDVRDALKGILENKENLDEIPTSLLKLAIKKVKKAEGIDSLTEKDKTYLQEFEKLSLKFLSIALGKEKSPGKLIKKFFIEYYTKTFSTLENVLPASMKPIVEKLYKQTLTIIQKTDSNEFDKDATTTILKAMEDISETTAKFIGANFERFMKEDFMKVLKESLQKITIDDKTSVWDALDL